MYGLKINTKEMLNFMWASNKAYNCDHNVISSFVKILILFWKIHNFWFEVIFFLHKNFCLRWYKIAKRKTKRGK